MEEIKQEVVVEEAVEKLVEEVVEETPKFEQLPYNKHDRYIPTEFQIIDYRRSWKKCYCGRQTWMNDNYCPGCGQSLGRPTIDE